MKQYQSAKAIKIQAGGERAVVAAAVRETVTLALEEGESDLAIAMALREASLEHIPEQGSPLWEFITGPLRDVLQMYAHADDATTVVARLLQLLAPQIARVCGHQTAASGVRTIAASAPRSRQIEILDDQPRSPFSGNRISRQMPGELRVSNLTPSQARETRRPPATRATSVLIWTDDRQISLRLSLILGASVALKTFFDIPLLIEALDSETLTETVVILDIRNARLASTALLTLTAHLPCDSSVVLWGDSAALKAQLRAQGHALPSGWVSCSTAVRVEDMSELIRCSIAPSSFETDAPSASQGLMKRL
jgi:hypothetical protein